MIYLSSKGDPVKLDQMNDFHLKGAYEKAQRIVNHMMGSTDPEKFEIVRYIETVRTNLWLEIERRANK